MIKIMHENDYSETDEFTLIKEMNHWIKQLKNFFVDDKKAQKAIADYFYYDDGAHQEDFKELQSSVKTLHKLWLKLDNIVEEAEEREYKKSKNESYRLKEEDTEIEVENPGLLEVPEGKNVDDLPLSHFVKLANKKGLGKIVKGLNNLQVWNKNKDPKLSKWAGDMIDKLNKKLKKDESLTIKEFSSNFDGTEIDEVEFYSEDLTKFSNEQSIKNAIEAGCTYPINVYDVDFEVSNNIVIIYEVPEEYYNPNTIESDIINILERLEDKIRNSKPVWMEESINKNELKDMMYEIGLDYEGVGRTGNLVFYNRNVDPADVKHLYVNFNSWDEVEDYLNNYDEDGFIDECNLTESNRDRIDRLIADMEVIGFEYDGTDNKGRLLFNSWDGNSTQAFPDWNEVEKYLENGSEPFEF